MKFLAIVFSVFALTAFAETQVSVTDVRQDGKSRSVTVTYDLATDAIVTIELYSDGVKIDVPGGWVGDVSKKCAAGTGKQAFWRPRGDFSPVPGVLTAKVNLWTESNPPDYMAVDFTSKAKRYYGSTNDLPFAVSDGYYRKWAMLFRRIPAKDVTFRMGTPGAVLTSAYADELCHEVTLTNDFYIGVFPVTQGQWRTVDGKDKADPSLQQDRDDSDLCPMDNISYRDTIQAVNGIEDGYWYVDDKKNEYLTENGWVNRFWKKTGLKYVGIPTEAQWEFACRAGEGGSTYDPASDIGELAWYSGNAGGRTHPVGLKKPNAWGLYDMLGNIWEHCLDHCIDSLGTDPVTMPYTNGSQATKTVRGGSYNSGEASCRSAKRTYLATWGQWLVDKTRSPYGGVRIIVGIH